MPQPLAGAGQGLQLPQALYPSNLYNSEVVGNTNEFSLAPGEALPIPAGRWLISVGKYCVLQFLDPVTTEWTLLRDNISGDVVTNAWSDGFNLRVINLTGCVVGATVTNGGNGNYVQSTTTITPSAGTSTWQALVGGAINTTVSVTNVGKNYGIAPLVFVDAPPSPGVQCTMVANIANGTVTSLTVVNQGAGYTAVPNISIVANPADPNLVSGTTAITQATAVCSLTGAGSITGALLLNPGAPVANTMTLTVAGAGATATVVPLFLQTITSVTVANAGTGYGTFTQLTSIGGFNTNAGAFTNPQENKTGFVPRPAVIGVALSGTGISSITTIYDGGLFLGTPTPIPITNGVVTTVSTPTAVLGSVNDTVRLQQVA